MKRFLLLISVFLGLMAFVLPVQATSFTLEFNYEFSEATEPKGPSPWLTATFDDEGSAGMVILTLVASGLTGTEFVTEWDFNLNPSLDPNQLSFVPNPGSANSISTGVNAFKADGDGRYDIQFLFPTNGSDRFGAGDVAIFKISLTDITANSFNFLSFPDGGHGPFLSAAHVQGIGDDGKDSGWVAPVPEPSTMLLLGFGLVGIAAFGRKKFRTS